MNKSCKTCWWQEGGRCYLEPQVLDSKGISLIKAENVCEHFLSRREMLERFIPKEKLIIASEKKVKLIMDYVNGNILVLDPGKNNG